MTVDEGLAAARFLATQAHLVGRASGREPWREALRRLTRGRLGHRHGWPVIPRLGTPWQDTISAERPGWRCRAAYLDGDPVFEVDYQTCRGCQLAWVELPRTEPRYQRCGLATAGLAALRAEHPNLAWHTLGDHFRDSQPFWTAIGTDVTGGYQQRELCPHVKSGG